MKVAKLKKEVEGMSEKDKEKSIAQLGNAPFLPKESKPKPGPIPAPAIDLKNWGQWGKPFVIKKPSKFKEIDQQRYEWFVAGFLYFYDAEIRNNTVDHAVYFHWESIGNSKRITVYLSPKPAKNYKYGKSSTGGRTDPPSPPPPPPPPMG